MIMHSIKIDGKALIIPFSWCHSSKADIHSKSSIFRCCCTHYLEVQWRGYQQLHTTDTRNVICHCVWQKCVPNWFEWGKLHPLYRGYRYSGKCGKNCQAFLDCRYADQKNSHKCLNSSTIGIRVYSGVVALSIIRFHQHVSGHLQSDFTPTKGTKAIILCSLWS